MSKLYLEAVRELFRACSGHQMPPWKKSQNILLRVASYAVNVILNAL